MSQSRGGAKITHDLMQAVSASNEPTQSRLALDDSERWLLRRVVLVLVVVVERSELVDVAVKILLHKFSTGFVGLWTRNWLANYNSNSVGVIGYDVA